MTYAAPAGAPVPDPVAVLGVDACTGGWVGVRVDRGLTGDLAVGIRFGATIGGLVAAASRPDATLAVVVIDIPIGLPDVGRRAADLLTAKALGPRRSSIFPTPVRDAVLQPDYPAAAERQRALAGVGLSKQSYALRAKILDVDAWVQQLAGDRHETPVPEVLEGHPELAFARCAGAPLLSSKKTWNGIAERRRLLAEVGIALPDDAGDAGRRAAPDDVVDAAVLAWVGLRRADGVAAPIPTEPERFSDGWPAAIWA